MGCTRVQSGLGRGTVAFHLVSHPSLVDFREVFRAVVWIPLTRRGTDSVEVGGGGLLRRRGRGEVRLIFGLSFRNVYRLHGKHTQTECRRPFERDPPLAGGVSPHPHLSRGSTQSLSYPRKSVIPERPSLASTEKPPEFNSPGPPPPKSLLNLALPLG